MSQAIAGTFVTVTIAVPGAVSADLLIPRGPTQAKLTLTGLDASNTVRTRKRTSPGAAWSNQTTFNSDQNGTAVTVAEGEQWSLELVAVQTMRSIGYKFSVES